MNSYVSINDLKLFDGEVFSWYNPDTKIVFHSGKMVYPKKPRGNWCMLHTHPIGKSGKPSEIDVMNSIIHDIEEPCYILSSGGLYTFRLSDNKKAREKLKELYKYYRIKNFDEFYNRHGNDEIPNELNREDFHKFIGVDIIMRC